MPTPQFSLVKSEELECQRLNFLSSNQLATIKPLKALVSTTQRSCYSRLVFALQPKNNRNVQITDRRPAVVSHKVVEAVIYNVIFDQRSVISPQQLYFDLRPRLCKSTEREQKREVARAEVYMPKVPVDDIDIVCIIPREEKIPQWQ